MPMFAFAGGLLAGVQLLAGFFSGDSEQLTTTLLSLHAMGLLPWALAGAVYARLANRSGQVPTSHRTRALLGAKAGAITSAAFWCVIGVVFAPWLWSQQILGWIWLVVIPAILAASALSGALQGALTAIIIGPFALEPATGKARVA